MITLERAKKLEHGDVVYHILYRNADNTPQRWRVNGKVKTWKRSPHRIEIPIKNGLYKYGYLTENDLDNYCLSEEAAILGDNVIIFDNGGKSMDRYSVYIHDPESGYFDLFLMSSNANMPNGVCLYEGDYSNPKFEHEFHFENEVRIMYEDLPEGTKAKIRQLTFGLGDYN
jgi:hypothetical protein